MRTLENLLDLSNLVSAFPYGEKQGMPALTPSLPVVYDALGRTGPKSETFFLTVGRGVRRGRMHASPPIDAPPHDKRMIHMSVITSTPLPSPPVGKNRQTCREKPSGFRGKKQVFPSFRP